jgi:hypothetical protein
VGVVRGHLAQNSDGLLWTRWWNFGFYKMWGDSSLAVRLSAFQHGLCSMELAQALFKKSGPFTRHGGALGDRRYSSYCFLTSALEGGEWSASRPGRALPPGKEPPGTHCTGGWVGPRAGPDAEVRGKILCLCRGPNPGRPVNSQTLYSLSYPALTVSTLVLLNSLIQSEALFWNLTIIISILAIENMNIGRVSQKCDSDLGRHERWYSGAVVYGGTGCDMVH